MKRINDLKIESDIFIFFNFTDNAHAKAKLIDLLNNPLNTMDQVMERQNILQGYIDNWNILNNFIYRKLDYQEVHEYFQGLSADLLVTGTSALKKKFFLRFSENKRNHLQAPLIQLILFLHKIQIHYLAPLRRIMFGIKFQKQIEVALAFLSKIDLPAHANFVQDGLFTSSKIQDFLNRLNGLPREEITGFWNFLATFEAYWSIAKGIIKYEFIFPKLDSKSFILENFYHPAIPNAVKNDLVLSQGEQVVVLTGPNMSGKSTLLKSIGLCVYLAHLGLGVPATKCEIPFFETIAISINTNDDLQSGYSHFMVEIQNLKHVVKQARVPQKCFAIFDELFRGTNVDDALDITQATLNGLTHFDNSFFFVSTHLMNLRELLIDKKRNIKNFYVECQLVQGVPVFSYTIREGWSTLKIGRILFDKEGLNDLLDA